MNKENRNSVETLLDLYRTMITARNMDLLEQSYTARGESFFHVSGAGHEASAILEYGLTPEDWLHCHYRDKALMLQRGVTPYMFFLALFNKDQSPSKGRQINAHMCAKDLNIVSISGPVGNNALQAVGMAETIKNDRGIVLYSLGEGTTQESEVLEAIVYTAQQKLPLLIFIHDNAFAISTSTKGKTFYSISDDPRFLNMPIEKIDGRNPASAFQPILDSVQFVRETRQPKVVVFSVDRLDSHTNADNHAVYRSEQEISQMTSTGDPILSLQKFLLNENVSAETLEAMQKEVQDHLQEMVQKAQMSPEPEPTYTAFRPLPPRITDKKAEYRGEDEEKTYTMLESIRSVLDYHLQTNSRVSLLGEDIEDPKGDVFGVTKGLSTKYPGRVINSPLSESFIVGAAIGKAVMGHRPVVFLQFADFLPLAFNQIISDLGTMHWRTDGIQECPVIVMVSSGGYKPGLGPFHAASMEGTVAHIPGVQVLLPSTASDAAGMLNAAFRSNRPTVFFYPKNLLNNQEELTSPDTAQQFVPIGTARTLREGQDLTFLGYGNTVSLCVKAADALDTHDISSEIIDMRSIMPWDKEAIIQSAKKTGRLIIVHEDNHSLGVGSEVAATVAESVPGVIIKRVTRPDTYVPCNFTNQLLVLPSYQRILETAVSLFSGKITWEKEKSSGDKTFMLEAMGSSPSDESITILDWKIESGTKISAGQIVAELEADKASVELRSPVDATVADILVPIGDTVSVGTHIAKLVLQKAIEIPRQLVRENPGTPIIKDLVKTSLLTPPDTPAQEEDPLIIAVAGTQGGRTVPNKEITESLDWTDDDIERRSGIVSRPWIKEGEDALTLALSACKQVFKKAKKNLKDVNAIICATGTPLYHTPSMASLVQYHLSKEFDSEFECLAYDISAACSGYIYGLHAAYTYLTHHPDHQVLLITTETLSEYLDANDHSTYPLFSDAATATLIAGHKKNAKGLAKLFLPILSGKGDSGKYLKVPTRKDGFLRMSGGKVFMEAVRSMENMLIEVCKKANIALSSLDFIVPHQANSRIINIIRKRLKFPEDKVYNNIRTYGNSSSNTIPLCLQQLFQAIKGPKTIGLVAFGGGFTYASALLRFV